MQKRLFILISSVCIFFSAPCRAQNIVVSVAPLHSVVAAVTDGTGTPAPVLLLKPSVSVHDYKLKPSDMRKLQAADVVFYGGKELETFLPRALNTLGKKNAVAFLDDDSIQKLPARHGGVLVGEHKNETKLHTDENEFETDGHFWLSPDNMAQAARITAAKLSTLFPENAETYHKNAADFAARTKALTADVKTALAPHQSKPYLVFHDAYQYFEKAFDLNPLASVTADAHHAQLSAKRVMALRQKIAQNAPVCLFFEPQQTLKSASAVKEGLSVYDGTLDPLGANLETGKDFYFNLIYTLKNNLIECFKHLPVKDSV